MKTHIALTHFRRTDDQTGRTIIRFVPYLNGGCTAGGKLTFAYFEAWEDEPATYTKAQQLAISSAKSALLEIAAEAFCEPAVIPCLSPRAEEMPPERTRTNSDREPNNADNS